MSHFFIIAWFTKASNISPTFMSFIPASVFLVVTISPHLPPNHDMQVLTRSLDTCFTLVTADTALQLFTGAMAGKQDLI